MIQMLLSFLGVCLHLRTTFPMTPPGAHFPHVACLDCGREFLYDWECMKRTNRVGSWKEI